MIKDMICLDKRSDAKPFIEVEFGCDIHCEDFMFVVNRLWVEVDISLNSALELESCFFFRLLGRRDTLIILSIPSLCPSFELFFLFQNGNKEFVCELPGPSAANDRSWSVE